MCTPESATASKLNATCRWRAQIEACVRKAAELGATVLQVYRDDGISGRTDERAGFQAALNHAITAGAEYMVVWDSARFSRDQLGALAAQGPP